MYTIEERNEFLKKHYKVDMSLSEIMKELGLSKGTVCGAAHRLGLSQRTTALKPGPKTVCEKKPKAPPAPKPDRVKAKPPPDRPDFVPPKPEVRSDKRKRIAELGMLARHQAAQRNMPVTLPRLKCLEKPELTP